MPLADDTDMDDLAARNWRGHWSPTTWSTRCGSWSTPSSSAAA